MIALMNASTAMIMGVAQMDGDSYAQIELLRSALEPFVALRDQSPLEMAKIIHKDLDGITPITLTVTKNQFKAALFALTSAQGKP